MPHPRTAGDYQDGITAASRSGLAEAMTTLGSYRESLVLIGGWAPYLILDQQGKRGAFQAGAFQGDAFQVGFVHVGSIDIDFVVDPSLVDAERYATIVDLLLDRGYKPCAESKYQFEQTLRSPNDGQEYTIRVDFLTPRPLPGQGRSHRHREVQGNLHARTLEGAEVALGHWFWYELEARLPDGAQTRVKLKVADIVGALALKGLAMGDRYVEKDAYDIYALCAYYAGGPQAVAGAIRPFRGEEPVMRGLHTIAEKFRSLDAEGPTWVARFLGGGDAAAEARLQQDAFQTVSEVCRLLGVAAR